jgi:hypothetical protein
MTTRRAGAGYGRKRQSIARQLAAIGFALPGSVVRRKVRCGKRGCRCKAPDPQLHGPYIQWTRKIEGKTVTRLLTAEQAERFQPWFDNARKLRELVAELEALSLKAYEGAVRKGERWGDK